ncbi:MAG: TonB-dependent receptor, partial [Dehalococcoidia bacterium]
LEAEGTLNIGEVVQNMSFVNGNASAVVTMPAQGASSRSSSIDLRGLGARSTLTLLDGKRLVNENVNALIPTIAMQRIDIVADGAAALYGSEAVAGVVNFVPYRSYDGLKLETFAEGDSEGDWDQHSVQVLWGGDVGELDVVLAGQFRQQSRLGRDERSLLANSGQNLSSNAPGNWRVPQRDENGQYTGVNENQPSPNCAPSEERTIYSPGQTNAPFGMRDGNNCWFDFGDNRSYFEPEEHNKLFGNVTWEVNDDLTLSAQGFRTRQAEVRFTSTSNPSNPRIGELPAARGEIPGNPFRAVDGNGNPLFGVDANGDGIPDRSPGVDLNSDGWDDYIVSGTLNNSVPLMEDVIARRLRPINKTHTTSNGHSSDKDNTAGVVDHLDRWTLQADFNVPFVEGWEGMAAWTENTREFVFMENQNFDITSMIQGLNCDVANDRDACYSPFMIVDEADNNSIQVMDAVAGRSRGRVLDELNTLDLVFNGEIPLGGWQLPGGAIGAAFGYQFREDWFTNTPSEEELAGVTWIGSAVREEVTLGNREVDSYFAELSIPILPNLELSAAVRREEFSTGQESTDPKFGITYAPTDWLTLRATNGDAFIAPTLEQLLNPVTCGLTQVTDPFSAFSGFTTGCGGGNPNLDNEQSESSQFGVDLNFGDFDLSVTWNNTEFDNRIVGTNGNQLMDLDFFNFQQATGFTGDGSEGNQPTQQQLIDWINNPASNK